MLINCLEIGLVKKLDELAKTLLCDFYKNLLIQ